MSMPLNAARAHSGSLRQISLYGASTAMERDLD